MGMREISDFMVFLPHMISLVFLVCFEYKSWKKSSERSAKDRKK